MQCVLCGEPLIGADLNVSSVMHDECKLREVIGGIGHHIAHDYWCLQNHDPDAGFTYRESAQMVRAILGVNPDLLFRTPVVVPPVETSPPAH